MISIKQIQYALAVDKTRHFKKAAEQSSVSQSALSTAVSELESQLKFQIFERDNKRVLVTPLGEEFLEKARQIKLQVEDLYRIAESHDQPLSLPFSLGVIPTIGPYLLPKVLPTVRSAYPDLKLEIHENQSHVLVEQVRQGHLDSAVLALPYDLSGLLAFEFWQEDFYLVCHPSDQAANNSEIASDEIDSTSLLLLKDGHCLKDHALAACQMPASKSDNSLASTSLYTLVQMVAGKMGTTLVPEMAIDSLIDHSSELTAVHLNEPGPHRKLAFIVRPNFAGLKNIEILKQLFIEGLNQANGV